jgi:transposase-like protein
MAFSNQDLGKEKYWQEIIEQYKQSGMSGAQFCKQHGLSEHKLHYWKNIIANRLKKRSQQQKLAENKIDIPFVPLSLPNNIDIANPQNPTDQIEISKIVLRISASTDKSTLACILQSLEKA